MMIRSRLHSIFIEDLQHARYLGLGNIHSSDLTEPLRQWQLASISYVLNAKFLGASEQTAYSDSKQSFWLEMLKIMHSIFLPPSYFPFLCNVRSTKLWPSQEAGSSSQHTSDVLRTRGPGLWTCWIPIGSTSLQQNRMLR